jgi:hypothetical protein
MFLARNRECLASELKYEMLYLLEPVPVRELGELCDNLSMRFQALAICRYLQEPEPPAYRDLLLRSACARRFFLERSRAEGTEEDRFLALSRSEAFFDALIAGHAGLARDIARASVASWNRDWEYEDDHCYFRILHNLFLDPDAADPERERCLQRIKAFHGDDGYARLTLCRGLLSRDAEMFSEGLDALIAEKQAADRECSERISSDDPFFWPRSWLFPEGLALIRLSMHAGMEGISDRAFALCPSEALLPWDDSSVDDMFRAMQGVPGN